MTKSEFKRFADALKTYFPKENLLPNVEALELWYQVLYDLPYEPTMTFLQKWMENEKFSPAISEIRRGVIDAIDPPPATNWGEAWETVLHAVKRYGFYQYEKAREMFDEPTLKAVRCLGWECICLCSTKDLIGLRAQFHQIYEAEEQRNAKERVLSPSLKKQLEELKGTADKFFKETEKMLPRGMSE